MMMTAEITIYPFQEDFVPPIKAFIDKLGESVQSRANIASAGDQLQIDTFPTCTVLVGEYGVIMDVLKEAMAWSYRETGRAVFVTKSIPGYEAD